MNTNTAQAEATVRRASVTMDRAGAHLFGSNPVTLPLLGVSLELAGASVPAAFWNAGRPGFRPGHYFRQQRPAQGSVFPPHPVQPRRGGGLSASPVRATARKAAVSDRLQDQGVISALHECPSPLRSST